MPSKLEDKLCKLERVADDFRAISIEPSDPRRFLWYFFGGIGGYFVLCCNNLHSVPVTFTWGV